MRRSSSRNTFSIHSSIHSSSVLHRGSGSPAHFFFLGGGGLSKKQQQQQQQRTNKKTLFIIIFGNLRKIDTQLAQIQFVHTIGKDWELDSSLISREGQMRKKLKKMCGKMRERKKISSFFSCETFT